MSYSSEGGFAHERMHGVSSLDASPPNLSTAPALNYSADMMAKPYVPPNSRCHSRPPPLLSRNKGRVLLRPADLSLNWRNQKEPGLSQVSPLISPASPIPSPVSVKDKNVSLSPFSLTQTATSISSAGTRVDSTTSTPRRSLLSASLAAHSSPPSVSPVPRFISATPPARSSPLGEVPSARFDGTSVSVGSPPFSAFSSPPLHPVFKPSALVKRIPTDGRDAVEVPTTSTLVNFSVTESLSAPLMPDDSQEVLGRAGSSTSAAFLVRSKRDSRLFIFKPADGEGYEEQRIPLKLRASVITGDSPSTSPQLGTSVVPQTYSQSEPNSPAIYEHSGALISKSSISSNSNGLSAKTPLKRGVQYGESVVKEVAAFLLDSPVHYSNVPETHAVSLLMPRNTENLPVIDPASVTLSSLDDPGSGNGRSLLSSSSAVTAPIAIPQHKKPREKSPDGVSLRLIGSGSFSSPRQFESRLSKTYSLDQPDKDDKEDEHHSAVSDPDKKLLALPSHGELQYMDAISSEPNSKISSIATNNDDLVWRYGSLTVFRPHLGSADDFGSSLFSVDDVHRIGILDVRLLNLDRHLGNMLVAKENDGLHLLPIDHAYSFPSYQDLSDVHFAWYHWKQAAQPFSPTSLAYVESIQPLADAYKLSRIGIRDESLVSLLFATLLLKKGAAAGLTLREIASLVQRPKPVYDDYHDERYIEDDVPKKGDASDDETERSVLERIVKQVFTAWAEETSCPGFSAGSSPRDDTSPPCDGILPSPASIHSVSPSASPFSFSLGSPMQDCTGMLARAATLPQQTPASTLFLSPPDNTSLVPFPRSSSNSGSTSHMGVSDMQLNRLLELIGIVIDKEVKSLKSRRDQSNLLH